MERRPWTREDLRLVRVCYADTPTEELAEMLGRTHLSVFQAAAKLGVRKSRELIASMARERTLCSGHGSERTRFQPGQVPANKGVRQPGWAPGRMRETQFRKGNRPHTWLPLNSTRLSKEGYLQLKVADTGYSPRDWVGAHVLLWEEAHGPLAEGRVVCFRDGDKDHLELSNLECVSRRELMARNTVHNLPKELVQAIQLNGQLKRRIRERVDAAKQDDGPA